MSKLKHSKKQAKFADELAARYGLNIPYAKKSNSVWIFHFLELFSFDPYLPAEEASKTGWHVINLVKDAYYWDTPTEHIARNLNLHIKDIEFIIETLNHAKTPLRREEIKDKFPDVTAVERLETATSLD